MAIKAAAATWALLLCSCQGTSPTYGYQPIAGPPALSSTAADADCLARASAARTKAAADIWAQGGEPAYHQTYAACMAGHGWKRVVVGSRRFG